MSDKGALLYVIYAPYWPPYRGDGARIREFLTLFRRNGWRVKVAYCNDRTHPLFDCHSMADWTDGFYAYFPSLAEPTASPDDIDSWCPKGFSDMIGALCTREHFDVAFVHLVFNSHCLEVITDSTTLRVLDADNIFALRHSIFAEAGLPYNWLRPTIEQEARAWSRADLIVAVQENEAEIIRAALPSRPVIVIPAARLEIQDLGSPEGSDLLVVGSDSVQNRVGLERFVEAALPDIRAACPEARLLVAGRVGVGCQDADKGIIELGVVEDLLPYYRQVAVVVAPVLVGTGLIRKTVDALCYGKCVVATTGALTGLEAFPEAYVHCKSIEDMGRRVSDLLIDRPRLAATGKRAFAFASAYFDASTVFGRLESALLAGIEAKS